MKFSPVKVLAGAVVTAAVVVWAWPASPSADELGVEWRLDQTHETEYTLESFAEEMAAAGLHITHQQVRWGEIWAEVTVECRR